MTIHIDYDREENKIESILASQSNVIRTLINNNLWFIKGMLDQSGSPCIQVHIQIGRENVYNFSTLHKFINNAS